MHLRCFRSTFGARVAVGVSLRRPPVLFRMLSRIAGVRRRRRASPIQPHTNHTAIHGWPILLHGHSCHWYLSELYICRHFARLLLPCTRLCRRVAGAVGWRLLARFQNGATCLGPNKALAIQAASCIFSSSPPLARASILYKETHFSVVLFHTVGPH